MFSCLSVISGSNQQIQGRQNYAGGRGGNTTVIVNDRGGRSLGGGGGGGGFAEGSDAVLSVQSNLHFYISQEIRADHKR